MLKTYDLKLGYTCNNRCIHCVIEDSKQTLIQKGLPVDISTQEAITLLQNEIKNGLDMVTITGGEATIRKDLPEILNFCSENKLKITLQTNGRMLANENIQNIVFAHPGISLVIALHGTSSEVHDSITQVNGSFLQTLTGIRAARKKNIRVIIKTVISKVNIENLPTFVPFMLKEGLTDINIAFPHAQGAARQNFDKVVPRYNELRSYILRLAQEAKSNNLNLTFETIPFCILPEYPEMMSELVYFCKDVKCTQVQEQTFDWNIVRKAIKSKMDFCKECFFNDYCEGPWAEYVEYFGDSEFLPVKINEE